jgi:hypothetical protein
MADWWGHSRSNYFKIKDRHAFVSWLNDVGEVSVLAEENGLVAIAGESFGGWPHVRGDDCEEFDFVGELSQHLAEGEIAVLIEAGNEKLRYITGHAVAVNSHGQRTEISLYDIYDQAHKVFGRRPPDASY